MISTNEISDRLSKCFSSVIHDVMRDDGFKNFVLNPTSMKIGAISSENTAKYNVETSPIPIGSENFKFPPITLFNFPKPCP